MVARFRPQNKIELSSGGEPIVEFETEDTCNVQVWSHNKTDGIEKGGELRRESADDRLVQRSIRSVHVRPGV